MVTVSLHLATRGCLVHVCGMTFSLGAFRGSQVQNPTPPGAGLAALAQIRELAKEQKASQDTGLGERSSPRHGEQVGGKGLSWEDRSPGMEIHIHIGNRSDGPEGKGERVLRQKENKQQNMKGGTGCENWPPEGWRRSSRTVFCSVVAAEVEEQRQEV